VDISIQDPTAAKKTMTLSPSIAINKKLVLGLGVVAMFVALTSLGVASVSHEGGAPGAPDVPGCGGVAPVHGVTGCTAECAGLAFVSAAGLCSGCMMDGTSVIDASNVDTLDPPAVLCDQVTKAQCTDFKGIADSFNSGTSCMEITDWIYNCQMCTQYPGEKQNPFTQLPIICDKKCARYVTCSKQYTKRDPFEHAMNPTANPNYLPPITDLHQCPTWNPDPEMNGALELGDVGDNGEALSAIGGHGSTDGGDITLSADVGADATGGGVISTDGLETTTGGAGR
jgi:hypothetical protein